MKTRALLVVCAAAIALVILAGDGALAAAGLWIGALATLFAVVFSVVVRLVGGDRSQKILRERLARGEITPAEFAEAQRILGR